MPFFSIIIPLYNKEKHIANTLQSVFDQHYTDYEIIVINDGSTDKGEEEVLKYNHPKIQYFKTENKGVAAARNYGIEKANGKLIAFLDADDYWYSNHLEILFQLYHKFPQAGLYTTSYHKKISEKSVLRTSFKNIEIDSKSFLIVDDFFESSSIDAIAWTSATAVPKNILTSMHGFDISITHGEDTDLWIRIALHYKVALGTFITAMYNLNVNNGSNEVDIEKKQFLKFEKFEKEEQKNTSLKTYLDSNRYSIALQYRIAGDYQSAKNYLENIDYKNLSRKHRFLIKQPRFFLIVFKKIQILIINLFKVHLSSFK